MSNEAQIPERLTNGITGDWHQAVANHIERTSGNKIEWGPSGPMMDGMNISLQFMYPPHFGIQQCIDKLNDPMEDGMTVFLTRRELTMVNDLLIKHCSNTSHGDPLCDVHTQIENTLNASDS